MNQCHESSHAHSRRGQGRSHQWKAGAVGRAGNDKLVFGGYSAVARVSIALAAEQIAGKPTAGCRIVAADERVSERIDERSRQRLSEVGQVPRQGASTPDNPVAGHYVRSKAR